MKNWGPDSMAFDTRMRLGVGDAFIHQPGVQLVECLEPQARREEPKAGASKPRMTFNQKTPSGRQNSPGRRNPDQRRRGCSGASRA